MTAGALSWLLPPCPIAAALAIGLLKPLMLAFCARVAFPHATAGRRFLLTVAVTSILWITIVLLFAASEGAPVNAGHALDIAAGAAVLATADLVLYSVWSLASYGFTVSMMRTLAARQRPQSCDEWAAAYGDGKGIAAFARDRAGVLARMKLTYRTKRGIALRRSARCLAVLLRGAAALLAVDLRP